MCDSTKEPHGFTDHKSEEKTNKYWNFNENSQRLFNTGFLLTNQLNYVLSTRLFEVEGLGSLHDLISTQSWKNPTARDGGAKHLQIKINGLK